MKTTLLFALILSSFSAFAHPSDYACKAQVFEYASGRSKFLRATEKKLEPRDIEGRSHSIFIKPFNFSVVVPDPRLNLIVLTISDFTDIRGLAELSKAVAAIPTKEVEASVSAWSADGLTKLLLTCEAL